MIINKKQLKHYIEEDLSRYPFHELKKWSLVRLLDSRRKYILILRRLEYFDYKYHVDHCRQYVILYFWYMFKHYKISEKIGVSIPKNCVGPGLYIAHPGSIIINAESTIGKNLTINAGVNIGNSGKLDRVPIIGDDVWIAPGAKIFGKIEIASGVAIGANSVVNKSVKEKNVTIAGVPAKIINAKEGSSAQI